jgi:hypothetical protein
MESISQSVGQSVCTWHISEVQEIRMKDYSAGESGSIVDSCTMLQTIRSRVRFQMKSLNLSIYLFSRRIMALGST